MAKRIEVDVMDVMDGCDVIDWGVILLGQRSISR